MSSKYCLNSASLQNEVTFPYYGLTNLNRAMAMYKSCAKETLAEGVTEPMEVLKKHLACLTNSGLQNRLERLE